MSALSSNLESSPVGSSVSGPYVEELHAFFKTRGMKFGSVEDLNPFVDRLDSDGSFADEVASMVRTIIYRERDGLSWAELMELLAAAVGGPGVEDGPTPEAREAVRRLMVFVESVFRTRRNPGPALPLAVPQPKPVHPEHKEPEIPVAPVTAEAATVEIPEPTAVTHATTDVFYRARMAAEEEAAENVAEEPRGEDDLGHAETILLHGEQRWRIPFEDFEERETAERGSKAWLWVAGFCALLLAFCAGLFVHQQLIVPLRDPNTPYQKLPPETAQNANGAPTAAAAAIRAQPAVAAPAETEDAAAGSLVMHEPEASPSATNVSANLRPRYIAPATIGAPPALMASHLVYAPPPAYPMMAEMTRTQGKVTVEAVVGKSGRVIRARAIAGHRLLRGAAVREVYKRRYRPYMLNDRPINVATLVTVDFRLKR